MQVTEGLKLLRGNNQGVSGLS